MWNMKLFIVLGFALASCFGCSPENAVVIKNATVPDTPVIDATVPDTPVIDATVPDTPVIDATVPDTPVIDATVPDAPVIDATVPDAPVINAVSDEQQSKDKEEIIVEDVNDEGQEFHDETATGEAEPFNCPRFEKGDGTGGTEKKIGMQRGFACVLACIKRKKINGIVVDGVTVRKDGKPGCWCELGMKRISKSAKSVRKYTTCFLEPENLKLVQAKQSSIFFNGRKTARVPSNALDNNPATVAVTSDNHDANPWWKAELKRPAILSSVFLMFSNYATKKGYYKGLTVQVRRVPNEPWVACASNIKVTKDNDIMEIPCNPNTLVKYVKVSTQIGEPLYLAEVMTSGFEVPANLNLINAKQSSTYNHGLKTAFVPRNAIDGNIRTSSVTSDNHDKHPWWRVELEHPSLVAKVTMLLSPHAVKKGYYKGLKVQVRGHPNDPWFNCATNIKVKAIERTVSCNKLKPVKFVKISTHVGQPMYLTEVKVLGYKA